MLDAKIKGYVIDTSSNIQVVNESSRMFQILLLIFSTHIHVCAHSWTSRWQFLPVINLILRNNQLLIGGWRRSRVCLHCKKKRSVKWWTTQINVKSWIKKKGGKWIPNLATKRKWSSLWAVKATASTFNQSSYYIEMILLLLQAQLVQVLASEVLNIQW